MIGIQMMVVDFIFPLRFGAYFGKPLDGKWVEIVFIPIPAIK